jgi:2-polyprenyl-6-methoxyphenol hydroxylase-like FAD-dependent oxidoreductase
VSSRTPRKAIVAGAGIGGLTAAATLRKVGLEVEIYERATELKHAGGALSLMSNGVLALRAVGVEPDFGRHGDILSELSFRTTTGKVIKTLKFAGITAELGAPAYGIHRGDLQRILLDEIGDSKVELNAAATGFEADEDGVRLHLADGRTVHGDLLVGADGIESAVRRQLVGPETARDAGYLCWLATPMYSDPERIPKAYGAHYWGDGARFGIANIGGGRVYWWGTQNMPAAQVHAYRGGRDDVLRTFAGWAPEILDMVKATPEEEIIVVRAQDRPFLEHWGRGRVTLLGDAAHPILTALGQGAALAMEDAAVLASHLDGAPDVAAALRAYEDERGPRIRALIRKARTMSKLEQSEGRLQVAFRNTYFRLLPDRAVERYNRSMMDFSLAGRGARP